MIEVEVILALPATQQTRHLQLEDDADVSTALSASGLIDLFADVERQLLKFGIFGRIVDPDQPLRDGDRVEIYRPLLADPKLARRRRVTASRRRKQGASSKP